MTIKIVSQPMQEVIGNYQKLIAFLETFVNEEDLYNYWHAYQIYAKDLLKEIGEWSTA